MSISLTISTPKQAKLFSSFKSEIVGSRLVGGRFLPNWPHISLDGGITHTRWVVGPVHSHVSRHVTGTPSMLGARNYPVSHHWRRRAGRHAAVGSDGWRGGGACPTNQRPGPGRGRQGEGSRRWQVALRSHSRAERLARHLSNVSRLSWPPALTAVGPLQLGQHGWSDCWSGDQAATYICVAG